MHRGNVTSFTLGPTSDAGDLASDGWSVSAYNDWIGRQVALDRPHPPTPTRICPYLPVASTDGPAIAAEILVLDPNPKNIVAGGDAMSLDLFNLLPAVYRIRDIADRAVAATAHACGDSLELSRTAGADTAALARRSAAPGGAHARKRSAGRCNRCCW